VLSLRLGKSAEDILFQLVEFATLTLDGDKPKAKIYRPTEIDVLLEKHGLGKKDEDTEMKS
jgi:20S proteasome subunit alpha 3